MRIPVSLALLISIHALPGETQKTIDPCPGSGGLFFGTPSQKDIDSGKLDFIPARFATFKVGATTKTDVVKALGQPAGWLTKPDGTSQLEYDYMDRPLILGMRQVMYTQFFFDPQMVLTRITYPGFDSSIQPVNFDGTKYLNRSVNRDFMVYTPEVQNDLNAWVDMIMVNSHRLIKRKNESVGDLVSREANHLGQVGRVLKQTLPAQVAGADDSEGLLIAVKESPNYTEFVYSRFQPAHLRCIVTTYSHREYGANSGQRMEAFIKLNQDRIQAAMNGLDGQAILTKQAGPPVDNFVSTQ